MNDAVGFFILSRVWDYLLERNPYDAVAQNLISKLKSDLINECSREDRATINVLLTCGAWKEYAFPLWRREAA